MPVLRPGWGRGRSALALMVVITAWFSAAGAGALDDSSSTPADDPELTDQVALVRDANGLLAVVAVPAGDLVIGAGVDLDGLEVLAVGPDGHMEGAQVALPEPDPVRGAQYHLDVIEAEALWPVGTGAGTTIAILDSGVRGSHSDLFGRVLPGACFLGGGGTPCAVPGQGPGPFHPHGTHVAGIAAAAAGNGIGVVGVAPDAQVLPVRVLDENNNGFLSDLAAGVVWAIQTDLDGDGVAPDVDVINLSIQSQSSNAVLRAAIDQALALGIPVIASAGNLGGVGNPAVFPASEAGVVGVGSVGFVGGQLGRAPTSSFGPWVDLVSPGVDIWSIGIADDTDVSIRSGTSMSAPQVSAAAAVIRSVRPELTPAEISDLLLASTSDLGPPGRDDEYGAGVLDLELLAAALTADAPLEPLIVAAEPGDRQVTLTWTGGPVSVTGWSIEVDGTPIVTVPADARRYVVGATDRTPRSYGVVPLVHYVALEGAASETVSAFTPPGAPTGLVVEPGPHRLELRWDAPADDGGSPIVDHLVRVFVDETLVAEQIATSDAAIVRDLPPRGTYRVEVSARTAVADGPPATVTAETLGLEPPGEPVVTSIIIADEALVLDWEPVVGPAEFYDIITPQGTVERLPAGITRWEGPPPTDRPARLIAVVAVNDLGSTRSKWQTLPDLPAPVADVTADVQGSDIVVTWTAPDGPPDPIGFLVEWGVTGGALVSSESVDGTSFRVRPDELDRPVTVSVRARVDRAFGPAVTVDVPALFETPVAASDLVATATDSGIDLTWTAGSGSVDLVVLERRVGNGDWDTLVLLTPDATSADDPRAPAGVTIAYRLRSVGPPGEVVSEEVSITVPIPLTAPVDLVASSVRPPDLDVAWSPPASGVPGDGYQVAVSTAGQMVSSLVTEGASVSLSELPRGVPLTVEVRALEQGRRGPAAAAIAVVPHQGYWLVGSDGELRPFGGVTALLDAVGLTAARSAITDGERAVAATGEAESGAVSVLLSDGVVVPAGAQVTAQGVVDDLLPGERPTGLALTPTGGGAWISTDRGRVIPSGDAIWFGDLDGVPLAGEIVGVASAPDGRGYVLAAADGGVFAFGSASFHGSMGGVTLNAPVVGVVREGDGYVLAAADGGVFAFGPDAGFAGSLGDGALGAPIVGIAVPV
ncbi:MAG: S8 family serine peptidase [Actinomycetota bacterium]